MAEASTETAPARQVYSISLHSIVDEMQTSHGLAGSDDYKQYHAYCTRRLGRLRHHQAVKSDLVHSSAYGSGKKTKRHAYVPRETPNTIAHADVLLTKLVESERAWAQGQELKALLVMESLPDRHDKSKRTPSQIRQHALQRFKKAVKHATDLENLLCREGYGDARTQQEGQAYASWMKGTLALERNQWKVACEELSRTIRSCQELGGNDVSLEVADLFSSRIRNDLQPLFRFALYEFREAGGNPTDLKTVLPQDPGGLNSESNSGTDAGGITFRGKTIPVENKSLTVLLLKLDGMQGSYDASKDEELMALLSLYDDAIHMIQSDLRSVDKLKAGPAVNLKKQNLNELLAYAQNGKLQLQLQTQEGRIRETTADAELAHLYDALLHPAKQVCNLPGSEEEDEFFLEANAYLLRVRAFRCYYIGTIHASAQRHQEAVTLWNQASTLASQASEEIAACDGMKKADRYLDELEQLEGTIALAMLRLRTQAFLDASNKAAEGGLLANLDNPDFSGDILAEPPQTMPIPCKPTFFDVAWNHAGEFPSLQGYIDEHKPAEKPASSGGILGWFRGS